jgi:hypothetical protein
MKKYVSTMVLALLAVAIVSFGQQIIVRDNASSTAPVDQTRVFGSGYQSVLAISEIASPTAFAVPTATEVVLAEVRTAGAASPTLRLSVLLADGKVWFVDHVLGQ